MDKWWRLIREDKEPTYKKRIRSYIKDRNSLLKKGGQKNTPPYTKSMGSHVTFDKQLEEEIEAASFEMNEELEPTFWKDKKLNKKIQKRLEEIVSDFIENLELEVKPEDIRLTGSLANYNWSKYSDVDLHIVIDFAKVAEDTDLVKAYFDAARARWNDLHSIEIGGYEVEVYIEDVDQKHQSSGVYSLTESKWIIEPEPHDVEIDIATARKKADDIETRINLLQLAIRANTATNTDNSIKSIKAKVRRMRRAGLDSPQKEFSPENIAFKILRRNKSLDRLSQMAYNTYDSKMSKVEKEGGE